MIKHAFSMIWLMGILRALARRTAADKVLRDKAFNIAKDLKYDGYQRGLASMAYKFLIKRPQELNPHLKISNWQKNFINQLLRNLNKEKCIHHIQHSKTISGVLI